MVAYFRVSAISRALGSRHGWREGEEGLADFNINLEHIQEHCHFILHIDRLSSIAFGIVACFISLFFQH